MRPKTFSLKFLFSIFPPESCFTIAMQHGSNAYLRSEAFQKTPMNFAYWTSRQAQLISFLEQGIRCIVITCNSLIPYGSQTNSKMGQLSLLGYLPLSNSPSSPNISH